LSFTTIVHNLYSCVSSPGVHLDPADYHKKLGEDNTVVIDVRNAYESDIGRFGAQQNIGGAELLVPDMRKSTDFPSWIEREETKEKLQGTTSKSLLLSVAVNELFSRVRRIPNND
jgi:predicted sulfurtransferase